MVKNNSLVQSPPKEGALSLTLRGRLVGANISQND